MTELQTPKTLVDTYQLYIDGNWVEPGDGRYDDISPASEQTIATAPDASVAQVDEAIAAARRAFDNGPWTTMSAEQRVAMSIGADFAQGFLHGRPEAVEAYSGTWSVTQ